MEETIQCLPGEMVQIIKSDPDVVDFPPALVILEDNALVSIFELLPGKTIIGRSDSCAIMILCAQASRNHCLLTVSEDLDRVVVEDLSSKNGTWLNLVRIQRPEALQQGDTLHVGTVAMRFLPKNDPDHVLYQQLSKFHKLDPSTACIGRTLFNDLVEKQIRIAARNGTGFAILYLQMEHIDCVVTGRDINVRETIMKTAIYMIRNSGLRDGDAVFRYSPNAFAILIPKIDTALAERICQRYADIIRSHEFNYGDRVSSGVISTAFANYSYEHANAEREAHKDVFLSYSREDIDSVSALLNTLDDICVSLWVDRLDMKGGDIFAGRIAQAINHCKVVIVALTPNAVKSQYVYKELALAVDTDKPIIPIRFGKFPLSDNFRLLLAGIHEIHMVQDDPGVYDHLIRRLKELGVATLDAEAIAKERDQLIEQLHGAIENCTTVGFGKG
ncbi:MAG: TIR domain-containing protein [Magnetococcales bacterium]|nr:TIR domain-containing protein [Magnetococcales bacterium]